MIEVEVVGVRVDMPANQPVVLLRDLEGQRYLPIWIGAVEATAIAFAQQGVEPPRPLTHDLLRDVIGAFDRQLTGVSITDLADGVFYASLEFSDGTTVSARPSDAIALALRTAAIVRVADGVLAEAGIDVPEEEKEEVEAFREFLDSVSPDDFNDTPGGQNPEESPT